MFYFVDFKVYVKNIGCNEEDTAPKFSPIVLRQLLPASDFSEKHKNILKK